MLETKTFISCDNSSRVTERTHSSQYRKPDKLVDDACWRHSINLVSPWKARTNNCDHVAESSMQWNIHINFLSLQEEKLFVNSPYNIPN